MNIISDDSFVKIVDIKQSEKNSLYSVFSQNGFEFSITAKGLCETNINKNMIYTEAEFDSLRLYAQEEKTYRHAVYLLGRRDYSSGELMQKLSQSGEDGTNAVARLIKYGYINDENYCDSIIEKYSSRYGAARVAEELKKRKIDREIWQEKLQNAYGNISEMIVEKIEKKLHGLKPKDKKEKDKLISYLVRQGYSYEDIKTAYNLFIENFED